MITVSLLEPNWKELFEQELSKIGLKKCKTQDTGYFTFKHGSRRFTFNENYSFVDVNEIKPALIATEYSRSFDDELFLKYINKLNLKKNNKRENENAIKFSQEFFKIRLVGILQEIHPSVSDKIIIENSIKRLFVKFDLFRKHISIEHYTRKKLSNIVNLDYMEEDWKLKVRSNVKLPGNPWYSDRPIFEHKDSLKNILQLLSQDSIKELAEENLRKINSFNDKIKENDRTIQWYESENEKYTQDSSKLDLEIAMKMKEIYETFRHRTSENKLGKSITTGEEGIPET